MSFDPSQFEQETISSAERLKLAREALARQRARDEAKKAEIAATQEVEAQVAAAEPQPAPEIIEPAKIDAQEQAVQEMFGEGIRETTEATTRPGAAEQILREQEAEQARLTAERLRLTQLEAQREADIRFAEEEAARKAAIEAAKPPEEPQIFGPKPAAPMTTVFTTPTVVKAPSIQEQLKGTLTGTLLESGELAAEEFQRIRKKEDQTPGDILAGILEGTKAEVLPSLAGFVAAIESLGEFVGGRDVPDIGGAVLGSAIESFDGSKIDLSKPSGLGIEVKFEPKATKEAEFISKNPLFLAGAIIGEVAVGAVVGAILGKVVKAVKPVVQKVGRKIKITPAEEAALRTTKEIDEITGFKPVEGVKPLTKQQKIQIGKEKFPEIKGKAPDLEDLLRGEKEFRPPLSKRERIRLGEKEPVLTKVEKQDILKALDEETSFRKPLSKRERIRLGEKRPELTKAEKEGLIGFREAIEFRPPKGKPRAATPKRGPKVLSDAEIFGFEKTVKRLPKVKIEFKFTSFDDAVSGGVRTGRKTRQVLKQKPLKTFDDVFGAPKLKPKKIPKIVPSPGSTITEKTPISDIISKPPTKGKRKKKDEQAFVDPITEAQIPIDEPIQEEAPIPDVAVSRKPKGEAIQRPDFGFGGPRLRPDVDIITGEKIKEGEMFERPGFGVGGGVRRKPPPDIPDVGIKPPPLKQIDILDIPPPPKFKEPPPRRKLRIGGGLKQSDLLDIRDPQRLKTTTDEEQAAALRPFTAQVFGAPKRARRALPLRRKEAKRKRRRLERERFGRKRFVNPLAEVEDVLGVGSRRVRKQSKSKKSLGNLNFF